MGWVIVCGKEEGWPRVGGGGGAEIKKVDVEAGGWEVLRNQFHLRLT